MKQKEEGKNKKKYNHDNGITPETIKSNINDLDYSIYEKDYYDISINSEIVNDSESLEKKLDRLRKEMVEAASDLEFEKAAKIRDEIKKISNSNLLIDELVK